MDVNGDLAWLRITHWKTECDVATPAWFPLRRDDPLYVALLSRKREVGNGPLLDRTTGRSILAQMDQLAKEKKWPADQKYVVHGLRAGGLHHRHLLGQPVEEIRVLGRWSPRSRVFQDLYRKVEIERVRMEGGSP